MRVSDLTQEQKAKIVNEYEAAKKQNVQGLAERLGYKTGLVTTVLKQAGVYQRQKRNAGAVTSVEGNLITGVLDAAYDLMPRSVIAKKFNISDDRVAGILDSHGAEYGVKRGKQPVDPMAAFANAGTWAS